MTEQPKVFLDTSVLIAAILNKQGASHFILELAKKDLIDIVFTTKVIQEARHNLLKKYGNHKVLDLYNTISDLKRNIQPAPEIKSENKYIEIISDPKDCHILAGADKYSADYLLTFDRGHFFTTKIKNAQLPFEIMLPGDFLKIFRNIKWSTSKFLIFEI